MIHSAGPTLGVRTPKFTAYIAEQARFQAQVLKQMRLSKEEQDVQAKSNKSGKNNGKDGQNGDG